MKTEETNTGYTEIIIKDAKAQDILVSHRETKPLSHIIACITAKEIWDKLHTIYERKSNANVYLLQQFLNLKALDKCLYMTFNSRSANLFS